MFTRSANAENMLTHASTHARTFKEKPGLGRALCQDGADALDAVRIDEGLHGGGRLSDQFRVQLLPGLQVLSLLPQVVRVL